MYTSGIVSGLIVAGFTSWKIIKKSCSLQKFSRLAQVQGPVLGTERTKQQILSCTPYLATTEVLRLHPVSCCFKLPWFLSCNYICKSLKASLSSSQLSQPSNHAGLEPRRMVLQNGRSHVWEQHNRNRRANEETLPEENVAQTGTGPLDSFQSYQLTPLFMMATTWRGFPNRFPQPQPHH